MNDPLLVAYYTSQLEQTRQVNIYSNFLEKIVLSEQRQHGLLAAEKFSLPVEKITKRIVEGYRYIFFNYAFTFYFVMDNGYKIVLQVSFNNYQLFMLIKDIFILIVSAAVFSHYS